MTQTNNLTADCAKCFALCCIALRFSRNDGFGHDKPAGIPCSFLAQNYACTIHRRREDLGYEGCIDFDCKGAGQIASQEFAASNWRSDTATARLLFTRFAQLLQIQEMKAAFVELDELELTQEQRQEQYRLGQALHVLTSKPGGDLDAVLQDATTLLISIEA